MEVYSTKGSLQHLKNVYWKLSTIEEKFSGWESGLKAKHKRSWSKVFKKCFFLSSASAISCFSLTIFCSRLHMWKSCIVSESNLLWKFVVGVNLEGKLAQSVYPTFQILVCRCLVILVVVFSYFSFNCYCNIDF